ncbi:MAG TPA: hypothetical protein VJ124_17695 [Pyrinomonadaceae bacterium]|nr:hypothetical protein [Pyrinomonadaceae bacterium]
MVFEDAVSPKTLEQLSNVRHSLLRLHKTLLEYQRRGYERAGGEIANSYQLLKLVLHDQLFAWLHHLSELVVQIDELLDSDEQPKEVEALSLLDQARFLITPSEAGDEFQRRYFESLQQSHDVVLAHSEVVKLLGKRSSQIH